MKRLSRSLLFVFVLLTFPFWQESFALEDPSLSPRLNNGKKWRIGYYEGGPWQHYRESLKVTVEGLMTLGWIDQQPLPQISLSDQPSTRPLWRWLAESASSRYIEFVSDAFWTSNWEVQARQGIREDCLNRLRNGYVDLIFAMGTWAGKDLANSHHAIPTMVMSTTDAVESGIIKSAEDSGLDHLHARCDPTRHLRQIRLFHDIFRFRKIGVVYNNNDPDGRVLSHLDKLEQVARERDFSVLACSAPDSLLSFEQAVAGYRNCVGQLAPHIDAFYISDLRGTEADILLETLQPLMQQKIPTWSTRGSMLVQRGALISVARENFSYIGPFYSATVAKILRGAKPRDLPQVFKEKLRLAINLETAERIGYRVPPNI